MKNKKEFLSILISVLICVFVFAAIVYATTTIGNDVTVSNGSFVLPAADVENQTFGVYEGTTNLIRTFRPTGSQENNIFIGDAGNNTMGPGGGAGNLAIHNIGIGNNALKNLTTGRTNIAIGKNALKNNTTGQENTAIGAASIENTTGSYNIAIGSAALDANQDGDENIAIGWGALTMNTGSGSIGIGNYAGDSETGSNKLFIDNISRWDETANRTESLIYGIFDAAVANQYLTINGQLQVSGTGNSYFTGNVGIGDTVPAYKLSVDGTASVSGTTYLGDTYFSGVVSASDANGLLVGEGVKITAGTASVSGACGTAGSLYIRTGQAGVDTVLNICDSDGVWNPTDL